VLPIFVMWISGTTANCSGNMMNIHVDVSEKYIITRDLLTNGIGCGPGDEHSDGALTLHIIAGSTRPHRVFEGGSNIAVRLLFDGPGGQVEFKNGVSQDISIVDGGYPVNIKASDLAAGNATEGRGGSTVGNHGGDASFGRESGRRRKVLVPDQRR
jgi:hypothetical protein